MKQKLFPFLIALSALSVSASAAFYSISGLSKLFAGAAFAVTIMAASLEAGKLVIASLLYQYRKTLPFFLKFYLTIACIVLIGITSMGIYGFLSAAYQETANKAGNIDAQIALIETKRDNIRDQLAVYNAEKSTINGAVADLQAGLANNVIQYTNAEGQLITTTSSSTRRALEKQLDQAVERQNELNTKIDGLNTQLFEYETEIVEVRTGNDLAGELGPLKYLSGLTGIPMDKIINYLLLTIIFVFDPLAIALVIAANFAFEQIRKKYKSNLYGEKVPISKEEQRQHIVDMMKADEEDGLYEEWDSTLNDGLEDEEWDEEELPVDLGEDVVEVKKKASNENIEDLFEDWESPSTNLKNELDLNKDGIVDDQEINFANLKIQNLERQLVPGLSTFRRNKIISEIERIKSLFPPKDDDLTIKYN